MKTIIFVLCICCFDHAHAMFMIGEIKEIPVERLIENLEKQKARFDKPKLSQADQSKRHAVLGELARLHAMIYAVKTSTIEAEKQKDTQELRPWYGKFIPFSHEIGEGRLFPEVRQTSSISEKLVAHQHLTAAIGLYRGLLKSVPEDTISKLGLAWCLEQAGNKSDAKTYYREVLRDYRRNREERPLELTEPNALLRIHIPKGAETIEVVDAKSGKRSSHNLYLLAFESLLEPENLDRKALKDSEISLIRSALEKIKAEHSANPKPLSDVQIKTLYELFLPALERLSPEQRKITLGFADEVQTIWNFRSDKHSKPESHFDYIMSFKSNALGDLTISKTTNAFQEFVEKDDQPSRISVIDLFPREGEPRKWTFNVKTGDGKILTKVDDELTTVKQYAADFKAPDSFDLRKQVGKVAGGEAAFYLSRLLDPVSDVKEIDMIRKQIFLQEKQELHAVTPLAIPLTGDVIPDSVVDRRARVKFDLDGTHRDQTWEWIHPQAAWLVYLPNGITSVSSGTQLFGSVTFWIFWRNGYDSLCSLDDDGNGEIEGSELRNLSLWQDRNSNGKSENGEIRSLESESIRSLSCSYELRADGTPWSPNGVRYRDGSTRYSVDAVLREKPGSESRKY